MEVRLITSEGERDAKGTMNAVAIRTTQGCQIMMEQQF